MEMKKLDKSVLKLYRRQGTVLCLYEALYVIFRFHFFCELVLASFSPLKLFQKPRILQRHRTVPCLAELKNTEKSFGEKKFSLLNKFKITTFGFKHSLFFKFADFGSHCTSFNSKIIG